MKKSMVTLGIFLSTIIWKETIGQNYNKIMGVAIKKAIGSDLKDYQIFSYPTDNFGLITSYENSVSDANFLCDMWNCIGINNTNSNTANWLNLNNFAGIGGGGTIELSQRKKNKVTVDAILPKIYDVIGISGGVNKNRTTDIDIVIGKAYLRKLRRDEIIQYINNLDNSKSLKRAYNNGTLVLVVADCVIENLSVSVKVDDEISAKLDAKLGIAGTTIASKIFQDLSLSVSAEKNSTGHYTFKITHPVIFARLTKKIPSTGSLETNDDFTNWLTVISTHDNSLLKNK